MKSLKILAALLVFAVLAAYLGCQSTATTSAKLYMQQENYDRAIEQLKLEVETNPANAEAYYYLGYCYGQKRNFAEMVKALDQSLAVSNKFAGDIDNIRTQYRVENFNRGVRKLQNEQFAEAIQDFETAAMIDPSSPDSYKNLAYAHVKMGENAKALTYYEKAAEMGPDDPKVWMTLGLHHYNMENYRGAIDALSKNLELEPDNNEVISYIALSYDLLGEQEKAREFYDNALAKNPEDPDLFFNRGRLYYVRKDYDKAIADFEKVVSLGGGDYGAFMHLGTAYLNLGEGYSKSRTELENSNGSKSRINELRELEKTHYQKAKANLEKARDLQADDANLWNNLGVVYVRLGMAKEGEEAFKKAGELNQ